MDIDRCIAKTYRLQKVYPGKNFVKHMEAHSDVSIEHIKEALENLKVLIGNFYMGTIDLNRTIGKCTCVEVTDENKDKVQMVYRKGREGRTPVLLEGEGFDTSHITIGISRDVNNKNVYRIFTAWYGDMSAKEPWDHRIETEEERRKADEFWSKHALIMDSNEINWERTNREDDAELMNFLVKNDIYD